MKLIRIIWVLLLVACIPENKKISKLDIGDSAVDKNETIRVGDSLAFKKLNEDVLKPQGCIFCHDWVANERQLLTKIVPGEPFMSSLYLRIEDGSMPLGGPPADKEDLEKVEKYIRQLVDN